MKVLVGPFRSLWRWLALSLAGLAAGAPLKAADSPTLANLSFEQLAQIHITTLSRRPTTMAEAPVAVTVLSGEEVVRSGAKTVAEALRLVPGLMVGQVDANSWAISSRGFNSEFATKMLVMMDGRSVYSPLFSGTFWDVQHVMLEDLEKIEVVRGPGSTLWGANAVNGVINIVSKRAGDTQGGLLYGGGGSPQQVVGGARYGGQVSSNTFFRVYGMYQQSDAFPLRATGQVGPDRWNLSQGGFRIDHEMGGNGLLTWQGDGYFEEMPGTVESACGANTLGRYRRNFSDTSSVELQAYFDYTYRRTFLFETPRQVADLDFQHNFALGTRQALMWGVGYRLNHSEYASRNPLLTVERDSLTTHLFSAFVEDVIEVVPDKVTLTPGCKLEHNDMTGLEPQPGLRLAVRPADGHLLWASVSRAVRMPGDGEYYGVLSYPGITPQGPGYYATEPNVGSERLLAYELGYRVGILKNLSADVATYYNDYDGVIAVAPNGETMPSGLPRITSQNLLHGGIYGGELALTYRPMEPWRLTAWYALSFADLDAPAIVLPEVRRTENRVPTHQACLRSSLDIGRHWLLDAQLRYVDNVDTAPAYLEADSRLAWRPTDRLELALTVQNLLHEEHFEFRQAASAAHASVPRGVYVKLTWRF